MGENIEVKKYIGLIQQLVAIQDSALKTMGKNTIKELYGKDTQESLKGIFWPKEKEKAVIDAKSVADREMRYREDQESRTGGDMTRTITPDDYENEEIGR